MKIAAVQMVSGTSLEANLDAARRLISQAVERGARLVALPEYFCFMGRADADKLEIAEAPGRGPIQAMLAEAAARNSVWVVGGTIPMESGDPDRVRNAVLVFDADGRRVARYDKIHLFSFQRGQERYDEAATIEPGTDVVTFDAPCGRVGLAVCYDLRFPELFRAMGAVDLAILPAAFTYTTGKDHWEVLLRARAIENQCYIMAPAQGGRHPSGRLTYGDTLVADPWGQVLGRRSEGWGVVMADVDPARLAAIRESLPALNHRRLP